MKKLFAFLLAAVLCCSQLTIPVAASSDTMSDRTTPAVSVLSMMGAIDGDGSGSLGLSGTLTRAQFCKIAVVVMGLSKRSASIRVIRFSRTFHRQTGRPATSTLPSGLRGL
jgi:hypothetical protein